MTTTMELGATAELSNLAQDDKTITRLINESHRKRGAREMRGALIALMDAIHVRQAELRAEQTGADCGNCEGCDVGSCCDFVCHTV